MIDFHVHITLWHLLEWAAVIGWGGIMVLALAYAYYCLWNM